jgi:probable O-glycosylation ligase (exosortase A-associated)
MRDLILFAVVMWGLSKVFARPFVGIYLWTWLSLMYPQKLAYGFAYSFPFAQLVGAATLVSLVTGKQKRLPIWTRESVLLLVYVLWVCFTSYFAFNHDGAMYELNRFLKIQLFIFLTLWLISDREKLDGFIWVIVLSLGFYGVKGGVFTILSGGSARVWGPEGTFIGGNNEMALALLVVLPLMRYLQLQETRVWFRRGLLVAMLLCAVSILGSQSRGAFLGIMSVGLFFWIKSRNKAASAILVAIVGAVVLMFMPDTWWDRMNTIETYDQDASAMGRINAWIVAWNVATTRLIGGGANMFTPEIFMQYAPDPLDVHDVHSIYFEVLGEQGFIGLAIWLTLAFMTWFRCGVIIRRCKGDPERKWAADLAAMVQVSMIGYATAGAFLGLSYFDLYYDLIAIALITWQLVSLPPEPQQKTKSATISDAVLSGAKP